MDGDGDGYGIPASPFCPHLEPDCDDLDVNVPPGAVEVCGNGIYDNCDGSVDESFGYAGLQMQRPPAMEEAIS